MCSINVCMYVSLQINAVQHIKNCLETLFEGYGFTEREFERLLFWFQGTTVAALTGTALDSTQKNIREALNMKHGTLCTWAPTAQISDFQLRKLKRCATQWPSWHFKRKRDECTQNKNTMNEIASVASHLLFKLGVHAYYRKIESPENYLLRIYHPNTRQRS